MQQNGENMKRDLVRIQQMINSKDIEMQNLAMTIFYENNKDFVSYNPYFELDGRREKIAIFKKHLVIYANRWRGYKHRKNVVLKRQGDARTRNGSFSSNTNQMGRRSY